MKKRCISLQINNKGDECTAGRLSYCMSVAEFYDDYYKIGNPIGLTTSRALL